MHESGAKVGLTATGTEALDQGFFVSGDARVAYSSNTYTGTGTMSGLDDYLFDIRALGGKDFLFQNVNWTGQNVTFDVTPYVGLGYRNLYNDFRGTTSTGVHGYRRDSQYLYVPVGVTPRFRVTDDARISTNIEFDELIQGWQASYGGDVIPGAPTINNHQHGGYGLRGSVMYEEASWSAGPFFNYWNINMSDAVVVSGVSLYEPHNQTTEFGLQARYRF